MFLEELHLIEQQIGQLDQEMAALLSQHPESVQRLSEIPGLGVDSARCQKCGSIMASYQVLNCHLWQLLNYPISQLLNLPLSPLCLALSVS